jgi:hypothetical protein
MKPNIPFLVVICSCFAFAAPLVAQPPKKTEATKGPQNTDQKTTDQKHELLTKMLTKVKLVGRFTVIGKDGPLTKEEYIINKVEKLPEGDKWLFDCRIKYGDHNVAIPLPIDVKWADATPIITLDELTIPGMGTFGARVVLHDKKYAGTWQHDKVGGHLFGVIEPLGEAAAQPAEKGSQK